MSAIHLTLPRSIIRWQDIVLFKMFPQWFFAYKRNNYHVYSFETLWHYGRLHDRIFRVTFDVIHQAWSSQHALFTFAYWRWSWQLVMNISLMVLARWLQLIFAWSLQVSQLWLGVLSRWVHDSYFHSVFGRWKCPQAIAKTFWQEQ